MCPKPGKKVYTFDGKRYTLVSAYNNEHDHYKVRTSTGKLKLIRRIDIFAIF